MEDVKKWLEASGNGNGNGYGNGVKEVDGKTVYIVDNVQTIITRVKLALAKGFILNDDLTLTPCYVAKGNGYFAHGKTAKEAQKALQDKIFENMNTDEAIDKFLDEFEQGKRYKGDVFYKWHHYLTGSCEMGRDAFVRNHELDLNSEYTVDEFIELCKNDYGGEVIRELKERWKND